MQYYQECIALGSKTGLAIVSNADSHTVEVLYRKIWKAVFEFERRFSRFIPGSELSMFNRTAGTKQSVSEEFRDLLIAARTMAQETDGLFNPFILPAVQAAGYKHSRVPGYEQDMVDDHSYKAVTTIENLELGDSWARIPYGTAIDIGGCGKGYLADSIRSLMPEYVQGYWLSFGGDLAVGGTDLSGKPWTIAVESAADPTQTIGTLQALECSGVATSGTTVHTGKTAGRTWHHIIDPRTRKPATTDILLATVHHQSALRADVLASCAVIVGSEAAPQFLQGRGVAAAILQVQAGTGSPRIIQSGNGIMAGISHA